MAPKQGMQEWEIVCRIATDMGYPMSYADESEIMDEIARVTPTFAGVSFEKLDRLGSVQWPCNDKAPEGTPIMHANGFVRGLRFLLFFIGVRRLRQILGPVSRANVLAHLRQSLRSDAS